MSPQALSATLVWVLIAFTCVIGELWFERRLTKKRRPGRLYRFKVYGAGRTVYRYAHGRDLDEARRRVFTYAIPPGSLVVHAPSQDS